MNLQPDPTSFTGWAEGLKEIQINESISTWNNSIIDIHERFLEYGLHKLVFRMDVETYSPDVVQAREAHTYVNVTKSELVAMVIKGGAYSVMTRGWDQPVDLPAELNSYDPDTPGDQEVIREGTLRGLHELTVNSTGHQLLLVLPKDLPRPGEVLRD